MAFANVLTLQNTSKGKRLVGALISGRPRLLAEQFKIQGLGVVGTAETRMPFPWWANLGSYLVLHGPRHESGSHGCSLWLRRGLQLVPGRPDTAISRQRLTVVKAIPTLLIVNLAAASLSVVFCVAHAPHSGHSVADIQAWWKSATRAVRRAADKANYVFLLMDANATLGTTVSSSVGSVVAEFENLRGSCFHKFLKDLKLCVPRTFLGPAFDHKTRVPPG
eukprot:4938797-Pyramimonas_sp.AAC.1